MFMSPIFLQKSICSFGPNGASLSTPRKKTTPCWVNWRFTSSRPVALILAKLIPDTSIPQLSCTHHWVVDAIASSWALVRGLCSVTLLFRERVSGTRSRKCGGWTDIIKKKKRRRRKGRESPTTAAEESLLFSSSLLLFLLLY